jgi:hypothetical protein
MAIKGKKKSRGSQARRRPAAAPRPVISGGRRAAWYKTPGGRISLVLGILIVGIVGFVLWNNAQKNAERIDNRQEALDTYTGKVRALLQTATPPAAAMQGILPTAKDKALDKIGKDASGWIKSLEKAGIEASSLAPPPAVQTSGQLFGESIQLYLTAARTYRTAADIDEEGPRQQILQRAAEARDRASSIWTTAVSLLDQERSDAELDPAGLRVPSSPA